MARDISFMQYMRAHGNTPGPTQRPLLTGAISGLIATVPYILILYFSDALRSAAQNFGIGVSLATVVGVLLAILAGMIYALIFKRAANDTRGGWLFGISFGFLLWMLGPVGLWQTITSRPVALGTAAMGIFGAQLVYGLALGLVFPRIHFLLQGSLKDVAMDDGRSAVDPDQTGEGSAK
jgi:hypothetical protein